MKTNDISQEGWRTLWNCFYMSIMAGADLAKAIHEAGLAVDGYNELTDLCLECEQLIHQGYGMSEAMSELPGFTEEQIWVIKDYEQSGHDLQVLSPLVPRIHRSAYSAV